MRLIHSLILLLTLMTSANCQQNAEGWLSYQNPNLIVTWTEKSIALGDQSKYDEAIRCFDEAIRLDPNNAMA